MSKELTPLDVLHQAKKPFEGSYLLNREQYKAIEKALKDYEKILTAKKCFKETIYKISDLPLLQTMEDEVKSLKALDIIKNLPQEEKQILLNAIYNYTKSEEKYDLVKGILEND